MYARCVADVRSRRPLFVRGHCYRGGRGGIADPPRRGGAAAGAIASERERPRESLVKRERERDRES